MYFCEEISIEEKNLFFGSKIKMAKLLKMIEVTARSLMIVAAFVWFFAGGMLIFRGFTGIDYTLSHLYLLVLISFVSGLIFYFGMFSKISGKHILRIRQMDGVLHPFYRFFNARSYVMMFSMISLGVTIRLLHLFPFTYLALFYITMGLPLLISSFRFMRAAINFQK